MNEENHLINKPIPALIKEIAIPASIGFFFNTMYNVVDTFYGGLLSTEGLAALSLSFPVFFVIIATGSGLSTGVTALIANALGAGKQREAADYAAQGISFAVIFSVILTIAGLYLAPWLFGLLGATGAYLELCLSYMNVIFIGGGAFMLTYLLNAILNSKGDTRTFRNFLITGFFLNLLLDPWFMFGWMGVPALGLPGVAWSTILIQFLGVLYLGYKVSKLHMLKGLGFGHYVPKPSVYADIAKQAGPASLNMVTVGVGIFIITWFIAPFGQAAIAAYGIATRVEQIFLLPTIGLTIATLTIVGQNHGAGNHERAREAVVTSLRYGAYIMTAGAILILIFARQFIDFFSNDPEVIASGAYYLRFAAFLTWAYAIMFTNVSALQGMKRPFFALWLGLGRQIIGPLVAFTILGKLLGLSGVWIGLVAVNWTAAVITIVFARKVFASKTS